MVSRRGLLACMILMATAISVAAHSPVATRIVIEAEDVSDHDASFIYLDDETIATRADFLAYLRRIAAAESPFVTGQPRFYAHFALSRALALTHPDHVHRYLDEADAVYGRRGLRDFMIHQWVAGQAMVYANFLARAEVRSEPDLATEQVRRFHRVASRAGYLDALVRFGDMPPTVSGLRRFAAGLSPAARQRRLQDVMRGEMSFPTTTAEYHRRNRRSLGFQKEVFAASGAQLTCGAVEFSRLQSESDRPLAAVGGAELDAFAYSAIFGAPSDAAFWQSTRRTHCRRWALYTAMAAEADRLGLAVAGLGAEIGVDMVFYLAARSIVADAGDRGGPAAGVGADDLGAARALIEPAKVEALRRAYLRFPPESPRGRLEIDGDFLRSLTWRMYRDFVPQRVSLY